MVGREWGLESAGGVSDWFDARPAWDEFAQLEDTYQHMLRHSVLRRAQGPAAALTPTSRAGWYVRVYNHSQSGGGGISVSFESVADISNSTISRNDTAALGGGIILLSKSSANIKNTSLMENRATLGGGGLSAAFGVPFNPGAGVTIDGSVIADNTTAKDGGGISGPAITISNTVIARNQAAVDGGGWFAGGVPQLTHVFIIQNTAGHDAGGVLTAGQLTLTNTTLAENHPDNCKQEPPHGAGCP
jgi:predicted outer membrane repeat protein